ncbi:MAG: hypothetical protein BV457_04750 [Thermoplasmata archaeon M9B1D]|nr:MAG: hypothetical protein BV457_04750 [Thermoplasmata archaeon M9B1D]
MIFHTKNSITIGQFADMIGSDNRNMIKKYSIWMPKKAINKAYKKLMFDFNKLVNEDQIRKVLQKDLHKLSMLNRIKIQYPILLKLIDIISKFKLLNFGHADEIKYLETILYNAYFEIYHRYPKSESDYLRVSKDFDLILRRYLQAAKLEEEKKEGSKELDFESFLIGLELIIAPANIRDRKLYTLPKYIDLALKKKKDGRD